MAFENLGKFTFVLKAYIVNLLVKASIVGPFLVMPSITIWKPFISALFTYELTFFGEVGEDDYFFIREGGFDRPCWDVLIS